MTAQEINALPMKARQYIMELETNSDPSGMVRENIHMREQVASLQKLVADDKVMRRHLSYCAVVQGLLANPNVTKDGDSMSISSAHEKAKQFSMYG